MSEAIKGSEHVPDLRSIEVQIYGRTYHLRGAEDGAYLQELAKIVDRKDAGGRRRRPGRPIR